jgi:hypothetical protein
VPTRIDAGRARPETSAKFGLGFCRPLLAALLFAVSGCGANPSEREVGNARAFEALLTAISLRNRSELERDADLISARYAKGDLSDAKNRDLQAIIQHARAGEWGAAERQAYEFRAQFGDQGSYFK